jgi:hypothetical protein
MQELSIWTINIIGMYRAGLCVMFNLVVVLADRTLGTYRSAGSLVLTVGQNSLALVNVGHALRFALHCYVSQAKGRGYNHFGHP